MRNFSLIFRIAIIMGIMVVSMLAISGAQVWSLRQAIYAEREQKLHDMVGSVVKLIRAYDDEVKAGRMPLDQAQEVAKKAIRALRWGEGDYYGVYQFDGVTLVHANPKNEGVNRMEFKDPRGTRVVAEIIAAARAGGGLTTYLVPRGTAGAEVPALKLAYAAPYEPWKWAVQAGVYIDDIDAALWREGLWTGGCTLVGLLVAGLFTVMIARSITRPLADLCGTMDRLAADDLTVDIQYTADRSEIGRIARAVALFREHMRGAAALRAEQARAEAEAAARQRQTLGAVADTFQSSVVGVVGTVTQAATDLERLAGTLARAADQAQTQAHAASGAAADASANVNTVAAASEQLSASISEISAQVVRSATIAGEALAVVRETDTVVEGLDGDARRIGEVLTLIQAIAAQTNLLALNATIEAARAGEAGKGFAVVANEVKGLANQTAKATEEIAAQITAIQGRSTQTVAAIRRIGGTIADVNELTVTIASAVEEQSAATQEIARNVQQAAQGIGDVAGSLGDLTGASRAVGDAAQGVTGLAQRLSTQSAVLDREASGFLRTVRVG
ncbi:methyl-accepting chemotaxis protein [Nitrospirillum sp. BR 11163]|uniref:methyl-accepting chemotaxis protein n=1 Tax=Nitrospirillum sp. BR 11163 TaxID=3104323 RepID=UPI002B003A65|nr:cache domain-containing protein [Nitrospirillum sp. BR 11163]MEA1674448.1 cache domain-containing protein [Nitrospirillum sp. BR 11163]